MDKERLNTDVIAVICYKCHVMLQLDQDCNITTNPESLPK